MQVWHEMKIDIYTIHNVWQSEDTKQFRGKWHIPPVFKYFFLKKGTKWGIISGVHQSWTLRLVSNIALWGPKDETFQWSWKLPNLGRVEMHAHSGQNSTLMNIRETQFIANNFPYYHLETLGGGGHLELEVPQFPFEPSKNVQGQDPEFWGRVCRYNTI